MTSLKWKKSLESLSAHRMKPNPSRRAAIIPCDRGERGRGRRGEGRGGEEGEKGVVYKESVTVTHVYWCPLNSQAAHRFSVFWLSL